MKLVVFDLDGVLVDSRHLHYVALNDALDPKFKIEIEEHLAKYDGVSTSRKLEMLTEEKGLPAELHQSIWEAKQQNTIKMIPSVINFDSELVRILMTLKERSLKVYCASNSIRETMVEFLRALGVYDLFDFIISNQEVERTKPHPEMYLRCILHAGVSPMETLIVEDSPIGKKAAYMSCAHVLPVGSRRDVSLDAIDQALIKAMSLNRVRLGTMDIRWKNKINIVIPMAGNGSRFAQEGYILPKPLIDVQGVPMIQRVVENLNIDGQYIFIVRQEHLDNYQLKEFLNKIAPGCIIVPTDGVTEGATCSVLLAAHHIDNDTNLLIANSDQFLEWDSSAFLYESMNVDGCISTFEQTDPSDKKWSYAALGDTGFVTRVAEKEVISTHANTGIYFWSKGSDFVKYARQMIDKNIRTNGEFYIAPVYNEAIADGKRIKIQNCKKMWGLGVPADLLKFLKNYVI
jgi:HAD superfamily hydrolase (TIGR01509 family)